MTPLEAWTEYTADLPSPQSYVDFGYLYLITSALQRRVWYYDDNRLYCNLYVIFVGKPALGKGLVLSRVSELLKYHRDPKRPKILIPGGHEEGYLFPVGADCSTFEQLLVELSQAISTMLVPGPKGASIPYNHRSLAFVLEELSSLFRAHKGEVVKLLLRTYDCNDYDYKTKHGEPDLIRRCCVNFLAGTQMDFLQEAHDLKIFGQGFSSRTIWLFETARRFTKFHIEGDANKKRAAKAVLLEHVKRLSTIYGQLTYSDECYKYLENWYINENLQKETTAGPRMEGYYGRKKVHVLKLAAAIHFGYAYDLEITLDDVKKALEILDQIEPRMVAGLNVVGRNKLTPFSREILTMIEGCKALGARYATLIDAFHADLSVQEMDSLLSELTIMGRITEAEDSNGKFFVAQR